MASPAKTKATKEKLPQEMMRHTYPILYEVEESHWWYTGRRRIIAGFVEEICSRIEGRRPRILDVGCGTGANLVLLSKFGDAEGVDISPAALAFCHERGLQQVRLGAAEALPYEDGTFDLVTALDVIEHMDDDVAGLREMRRVLRPGGRILLFVPTFMFLWGVQDDVSHHRRRYRLPELRRVVREAGFEVERTTYANITFFLPILLVRKLMRLTGISTATENKINVPALNGVLGPLLGAESKVLRHTNLPFGVSGLCVARVSQSGAPDRRCLKAPAITILRPGQACQMPAGVDPSGLSNLSRCEVDELVIRNRSIICFGGEDWWYHHPHSKAHLMSRFARAGNKVIFVNSISMGLPNLAHKDLLPRIRRKLKSYSKLAQQTEEGITVVSPVSFPFFGSALARAANRRLLGAQLRKLAANRGLEKPILWIAIPTAAGLIGHLDESVVIYHVSDKYDTNTMDHATDPALIRKLHEGAIDAADIILYSGRKLFQEVTRGRERSHLLEHGVDFEHWRRVGAGALQVAPAIAQIPRPRLGYFGAIEPWLVDQELIKRAARERPEWQWVFIGNRSRGMDIEKLPNTHFLPPVPYAELPNYAAGFDVCVLPWETERPFTSYGSAIKVREYLATGKPVVISPLPEYEHLKDVLRIARTRDDFFVQVEASLHESDPALGKRRQAAVADGTWDARAEWVSELLEQTLERKASESRA